MFTNLNSFLGMCYMQNEEIMQFNSIYDEAKAHFDTGRYVDAAKTLEHLISECIRFEKYEDMFYFVYRALIAWYEAGKLENVIRLYQKIGIFSIKYSTKRAIELSEKSIDLSERGRLLNIVQKNLSYLDQQDKRTKVIFELVDLYEELINLNDDYLIQKDLYEKSIELVQIVGATAKQNQLEHKLAELLLTEGDYQLKHASFDAEEIALRLYLQAKNSLTQDPDSKQNKKIDKKIKKMEEKIASKEDQ
ncbi:MAG: hypothetical protein INQ03_12950 [Candidatus Heimdallarchaeota archaeon]|nr:hypothetical protein [Candidatus Heimdallarchaeota archaeon]